MSTIIGKIKPTLDQQIAYLRKDRTMMENGLTLLEDPKDIGAYEEEIVMMKAIEENLVTVKMMIESRKPKDICGRCQAHSERLDAAGRCPKCAISEGVKTGLDDGHYEFRNPLQKWPGVGDSVMYLIEDNGKSEWVDAYVTATIQSDGKPGVIVRTFCGTEFATVNISRIQTGKPKEVSNG